MTGKHHITVYNNYLKYEFEIRRNITILCGDSAIGKTELVKMIEAYELYGESSGVTLICDKECKVVAGRSWNSNIKNIEDSIIFIDEGNKFINSKEFADVVKESSNYFVIVTRERLNNLPYSKHDIYGIRKSGKYGETKQTYNEMYNIYSANVEEQNYIQKYMGKGKLENKIIVYHGNKNPDMIPVYGKKNEGNDFGRGFYTTQNRELAKEWAWGIYAEGDIGYLHTYELNPEGLKVLDLTRMDSLHWIAELLYNKKINLENREAWKDTIEEVIKKYKIHTENYDVIIGYRADNSYFTYAEEFVAGAIYRETMENALRFGDFGVQVFVKSEKAFKRLKKAALVEEVPQIYLSRYKERDKAARDKYDREKKYYNKSAKKKHEIKDFI